MRKLQVLRGLIAASITFLPASALAQTIQLSTVVSGLSSPVFVGNAGDGLNRLFIVEQAGIIKRYTPHSLRHTFATQMLNAGVTLEVLKELMGHRTLQMTLCYAQLYETTKRQQYDQAMTRIEKRQAGLGR